MCRCCGKDGKERALSPATIRMTEFLLLLVHLSAIYVINSLIMLVAIGLIRLPRLAFALCACDCCQKTEEKKNTFTRREYGVRLVTTIMFPIISLIIQSAVMFLLFCSQFENQLQRSTCHFRYSITLGSLIFANTILDIYLLCNLKVHQPVLSTLTKEEKAVLAELKKKGNKEKDKN